MHASRVDPHCLSESLHRQLHFSGTLHCVVQRRPFCLVLLDLPGNGANVVDDGTVFQVVLVVLSLDVDECVDFVEFHVWLFVLLAGKMLFCCTQEKHFNFV